MFNIFRKKANNNEQMKNMEDINPIGNVFVKQNAFVKNITKEKQIALFIHSFNYPHKLKENDNDYPNYLSWNYGITNPKKYHISLIENDYFEKAKFEDIICKMTKNELVDILEKYKIEFKKQCKKDELLNIINTNLKENTKKQICENENLYIPSTKGNSILKNNFVFLQLYDNRDKWRISENEYNEMVEKTPQNFKFNDIIWAILNERVLNSILNKKYDAVRNTLLAQAEFLEKEKVNQTVLKLYIEILLYDINLEGNLIKKLLLTNTKNEILKDKNILFIIPYIANKIQKYKEFYSNKMVENIYENNPQIKIITLQEFKKIVELIINDNNYKCDNENYNILKKILS